MYTYDSNENLLGSSQILYGFRVRTISKHEQT